jgi:hypothetical protein
MNQGRYPDGFCPGGTDENSPVIYLWEQKSRRAESRGAEEEKTEE